MSARFDLLIRYGRSPAKLRDAAKADPAVRQEIERELAELAGVPEGRCVVTKEYVAALRAALE